MQVRHAIDQLLETAVDLYPGHMALLDGVVQVTATAVLLQIEINVI